MGNDRKVMGVEAPRAERGAIADLDKSLDVAVTRITLRAKLQAAIADAAEAERAADALRIAAVRSNKTDPSQVSLVPKMSWAETAAGDPFSLNSTEELYHACNWLINEQSPRLATKNEENDCNESAIAMSILALHDRRDGPKKIR